MEIATTSPTTFFESKLYESDFVKDNIPKFKAADMKFLNQLPVRTTIPIDEQKSILRTFYRENSSAYFFADKIKTILSEIEEHPTKGIVEQSSILVTPSGYGKTRQAFLLACNAFSIYSNLTSAVSENPLEPFEHDNCMGICYDHIRLEMKYISNKLPLSTLEANSIHTIFLKQILLKLIVLYFWIEKYGNEFKPYHFLLSQINGRSLAYGKLLSYFYTSTPSKSLEWTLEAIKEIVCALNIKVNIITDEASSLAFQYKDQFLSPANNPRSILSAYSNALAKISYCVGINLMCGTSMRLVNASEIISAFLKPNFTVVYELPSTGNDKQLIIDFWNKFIKVDDLDLANNLESRYWEMIFFSRWRLVSYIVENISFKNSDIIGQYCTNATEEKLSNLEKDATQVKEAKLRVLRFAIISAFTILQNQITTKLQNAVSTNLIEKRELQQIYLETLLSPNQYVDFEHSKTKEDFVNLGITFVYTAIISTDQISVKYKKIRELVTLKAIATCIDLAEMVQEIDSVLLTSLRSTYNAQLSPTEKGKPFEILFIASLLSTTDKHTTVGEKFKIEPTEHTPKWLFEVPFVLKDFGPTTKYDATSNSDTIALLNIIKSNYNAALFPSVFMKPDTIIPLLHENKLYLIVFGFKYYSKDVSIGTVLSNEASTDLSKVYSMETSEGIKQDEQKARLFYSWFADCQNRDYAPIDSHDRSCKKKASKIKVNPYKDALCVTNILRVHVCLPNSQKHFTETCYYKNGDAKRYFNLESIKNIVSQDAYQHILFAYRSYIGNQKGSTVTETIEPATKRPRIEASSSLSVLQPQVNTAKLVYVRIGKDDNSLKAIKLVKNTVEELERAVLEVFSTEVGLRKFRVRLVKDLQLLPLNIDETIVELEKHAILQLDFIMQNE